MLRFRKITTVRKDLVVVARCIYRSVEIYDPIFKG